MSKGQAVKVDEYRAGIEWANQWWHERLIEWAGKQKSPNAIFYIKRAIVDLECQWKQK